MHARLATMLLFGLLLAGCASGRAGDAVIHDDGPGFKTSRYRVEFPAVDLSRSATHVFRVTRLPRETFLFGLAVAPSQLEEIKRLHPRISYGITDARGAQLLEASGTLEVDWHASEGGLLVYQGGWVPRKGPTPYMLTIRVEVNGGSSHGLEAVPVLKGGGLGTL
jgi:hypothetical protein